MYKKVQENISNIQSNINQNSEFFFNQLMGNFDHTVQNLKSVPTTMLSTMQEDKDKCNNQIIYLFSYDEISFIQ